MGGSGGQKWQLLRCLASLQALGPKGNSSIAYTSTVSCSHSLHENMFAEHQFMPETFPHFTRHISHGDRCFHRQTLIFLRQALGQVAVPPLIKSRHRRWHFQDGHARKLLSWQRLAHRGASRGNYSGKLPRKVKKEKRSAIFFHEGLRSFLYAPN